MYLNWNDAFSLYYLGVLFLFLLYTSINLRDHYEPASAAEEDPGWVLVGMFVVLWPLWILVLGVLLVFVLLDNLAVSAHLAWAARAKTKEKTRHNT
jgi:hypothetical protein